MDTSLEDQHHDEQILKIVACLAALRECHEKIRTCAWGTRLMKRDLLVFPLPVSQAPRSCIALVSAWRAIVSLQRFRVNGKIFLLKRG